MNPIDKLAEIFSHLPGIGPRQARRFVYFLLSRNGDYSAELIRGIEELKSSVHQCELCRRFYAVGSSSQAHRPQLCNICSDPSRDASLLMIVPRDTDLDAVEKSHSYRGLYFVLGGALPILEKEPERRIRINELRQRVKNANGSIKEIILAMNANAEGENTADFLREELKPLTQASFSELGRGLSTGAELEYADPETLKNALLHRTK